MQLPKYQTIILVLVFFTLFSCFYNEGKREINFYHWKTTLDFTPLKKEYTTSIGLSKLYIRLFDVKWVESQKSAFPFATLQVKKGIYDTLIQIVPTVYITNEAIKNTPEHAIPNLAEEISHKILRLSDRYFYQHKSNNLIKEIQIDCDWTEGTKDKYFRLLHELEKSEHFAALNHPELSATIRLHQVKYYDKTGVPPVSRSMLMFYNMGDLQNIETENSILDIEITKKYLANLNNYPLECDAALPLYSWAVVYRDGRIVKLINTLKVEELKQHKKFQHIKNNRFKVIENNYINENFVYEGDEFRVEEVSVEKLEAMMELIIENTNNKNFSICFYHLDDKIINNYYAGEIIKIAKK